MIAVITWVAKKVFVRKKGKVEDSDILSIQKLLDKQGGWHWLFAVHLYIMRPISHHSRNVSS